MSQFVKTIIAVTACIAAAVLTVIISGTEACSTPAPKADAGVAAPVAPTLDAAVKPAPDSGSDAGSPESAK